MSVKPILFSCELNSDTSRTLSQALRLLAAAIDRGEVTSGSLRGSTEGTYIHLDATQVLAEEERSRKAYFNKQPDLIKEHLIKAGLA